MVIFLCRHLFFHDVKLLVQEGKLKAPLKDAARLAALFIQAERGDFGSGNDLEQLLTYFPHYADSEEFKVTAQAEYARLRSMKQDVATVTLLREVCALETYGLDTFSAKDVNGNLYEISVGPRGILVNNIGAEDLLK